MTSLALVPPWKGFQQTKKSLSRSRRYSRGRKLQNAADTLPLSLCDEGAFYTVSVTIGTQPFQLVVDTASTDLWVMDTDCLFCVDTPNRYDSTNATPLFDNDDENYYESAGGGNLMYGKLYRDQVSLGSSIRIPEQGFAVIMGITPFEEPPCINQWDGYLGLAPANEGITGEGQVEHFATVMKHLHEALPYPVFSLHLTDDDARSELILGGVDRTFYNDCLIWHDVQPLEMEAGPEQDILWNLLVETSFIGDFTLPTVNVAFIDSSITDIVGPAHVVAAMVEHTNGWFCGKQDELDYSITNISCDDLSFEFAFGPCDIPVDPLVIQVDDIKYIIKNMVTLIGEDQVVNLDVDIKEWCSLVVFPDSEFPGWLLGHHFFHSYFVAFDIQHNKVGLASRRGAENMDAPVCPEDAFLDIHNMEPTDSSPSSTTAPSSTKPSSSQEDDQEGDSGSLTALPSQIYKPSQAPIQRLSEAPQAETSNTVPPSGVPLSDPPVPYPTMMPRRKTDFPHSRPNPLTMPPLSDSENSNDTPTLIPFVIGAAVVALLVLFVIKRKQHRKYQRAAWSEGYTMGGDLELRAIS